MRVAVVALACIFAGCMNGRPGPSFATELLQPRPLNAEPRSYTGAAWLSEDLLALSAFAPISDEEIVLVTTRGEVVDTVLKASRRTCNVRNLSALAPIGSGDLAFAESCRDDQDDYHEFFAYDVETGVVRSLGPARQRPKVATWAADMRSAVYTAEGTLCATLYIHDDEHDGPLQVQVTAQGHTFPLGEDLDAADDGCTSIGTADYPAYPPDGATLAAFVAYVGDVSGQDRIDLPHALVTLTGDATTTVIDGVREPRGLLWLGPDCLAFAGDLAGTPGVWVVNAVEQGLTRVSEITPGLLTLSPDRRRLLATAPSRVSVPPELESVAISIYDIGSVGCSAS